MMDLLFTRRRGDAELSRPAAGKEKIINRASGTWTLRVSASPRESLLGAF